MAEKKKVIRIKEGSFVDPEKVKRIVMVKQRIKLSEKDAVIMNRYCYNLDAYK